MPNTLFVFLEGGFYLRQSFSTEEHTPQLGFNYEETCV